MGQVIDGRAIAERECIRIKKRVQELKKHGISPKLAVILVGDNPASHVYVNLKGKKAAELGIEVDRYDFAGDMSEEKLIGLIRSINADDSVHGILVQMPLPEHMDSQKVLYEIAPEKDVDGLHPYNAGALATGREGFLACTPKGVMTLVDSTGIDPAGKKCVVVGRSNLVGKPAALMMLGKNATVTMCHSYTENLGGITREADILISATGQAGLIGRDMVKEGAVVIDVGQSRVDGVWRGDVDYDAVLPVAGHITPVPGGVGPMTITMLMDNTVESAEKILHNHL